METTVVVGASVGGVRTAQSLRNNGYDGKIIVVDEEPHLPYDKPPLSKAFLAGSADDGLLITREDATASGIELQLGRKAEGLDVAERKLEFADGSSLAYENLVIATGAHARPSPWGMPLGVHVLRTRRDSVQLRQQLADGGPVVIVGAGFIGAEVASTATKMGVSDVAIVDPEPTPMSRALDGPSARRFLELYRSHGVQTYFGVGVSGIERREGLLVVGLSDGRELTASTVVVGIGASPNDGWLRGSGLLIDDGVICDQYCRAVGSSPVYAVGDVARWWSNRDSRHARMEHWTNAVEQASCVAHNIVNPDEPRAYDPISYVWSDQFDWRIQFIGRTGGTLDATTIEGSAPSESFLIVYTDPTGLLAGAVTVNWPRALSVCRKGLNAADSAVDTLQSIANLARPTVKAAADSALAAHHVQTSL